MRHLGVLAQAAAVSLAQAQSTNTSAAENHEDQFPVAWIWGASGVFLGILLLYMAPRIFSVSVEDAAPDIRESDSESGSAVARERYRMSRR